MSLAKEVHELIVIPTLREIGMGGEDAEKLMICTGMQESGFAHITQMGGGPAKGPWQVEGKPSYTHSDIKGSLLRPGREALLNKILIACNMVTLPKDEFLIHNWKYNLIIARLVYARHLEPLPSCSDIEAMARYYVKYYNAGGKARLSSVIKTFDKTLKQL